MRTMETKFDYFVHLMLKKEGVSIERDDNQVSFEEAAIKFAKTQSDHHLQGNNMRRVVTLAYKKAKHKTL